MCACTDARTKEVVKATSETIVITNNHYRAQALVNALMLESMLTKGSHFRIFVCRFQLKLCRAAAGSTKRADGAARTPVSGGNIGPPGTLAGVTR